MAEIFTIRFEDASSTGGGTGGGAGGGTSPADLIGADPVTPRAGATGPIGDDRWWKSVTLMQLQTMNRMREALEKKKEEPEDPVPDEPKPWMTRGQMAAMAGAAASGNGAAIGGVAGNIAGTAIGGAMGGPPGAAIGGVLGGMVGGVAGSKADTGGVLGTATAMAMDSLVTVLFPPLRALSTYATVLTDFAPKMANAALAFDERAVSKALVDLSAEIPILGVLTQRLGGVFLGLMDSAEQGANRLARYSPELAVSFAMQDVRTTMRDLERAQRLGPQLANLQDRRYELENAFADALTPIAEAIIPLLTEMLAIVRNLALAGANGLGRAWEAISAILNGQLAGINALAGWVTGSRDSLQFAGTLPGWMREAVDAINNLNRQEGIGDLNNILAELNNQDLIGGNDRNDRAVNNGQAFGPAFGAF